ncbi:MAG: ATP-grasp domain-containing protein [Bacteroidales bacterium]|nr:ATP-grasp domain-containing protein [Bacteroidales bacterium]
MNIVFLSPNFPLHFYNFCNRLKNLGCNVLGIGDCQFDNLSGDVKSSLTEYYYVNSLEDYDQVMRAVAFFTFKYGKINHIESQNEYWLQTQSHLREDFNIENGIRTSELENVKLKSQMKKGYTKAGIKTARWMLIDSKGKAEKFAKAVGFPVIIKPDNGVGASNTYKISNLSELDTVLGKIDIKNKVNIIEEFVPGHVETFDGITDKAGNIVFCTGQVMKITPLAMLNGNGENISYTTDMQHSDLLPIGTKAVKAFEVKQTFFHFEFFRLDEDKDGLGKKGEIIGLEVNMRAPGGYIPDKMNYAYDVDVYQIWAETLVFGENHGFKDYEFKRFVTHYGRGANVSYCHSAEEIREKFFDRLLIEKIPPKSISGGMGAQIFILKSQSINELENDGEYILAKE